MAKNIETYKSIDLSNIPVYKSGNLKGRYNWELSVGNSVDFVYGDNVGSVVISEYINPKLKIKYLNTEHEISIASFKNGKLGKLFGEGGITKSDIEKQRIDRLGESKINKYGVEIKIIEYSNEEDIKVIYNNDIRTVTKTTYREFRKENRLKTPFDRTVYDIGYIGIGKYKVTYTNSGGNTVATKEYEAWRSMIRRCYSKSNQYKAYSDCTVCEEWHNFQNFAKWYEENYYTFKDEAMHVDKDIKIKNNRIYSPNNCIITPGFINVLFEKNKNSRGKLPIGVYKHRGKYTSQCGDGTGKQKWLGDFNSEIEAFNSYKIYKEKLIKDIAVKYKDEIPSVLYKSLMAYEVNIND